MTVSQRLKELRGEKSLQEFVEPLGITAAAISNVEHGRSKLSIDLAEKICEVYKCSMDWLIRGIGQKENSPTQTQEAPAGYALMKTEDIIFLQNAAIQGLAKQVEQLKHPEGLPIVPELK